MPSIEKSEKSEKSENPVENFGFLLIFRSCDAIMKTISFTAPMRQSEKIYRRIP